MLAHVLTFVIGIICGFAIFCLGMVYGRRRWADALTKEQQITTALRTEVARLRTDRDDARATITQIKGAAAEAKLDIKKVFPFLTLICALGLGLLDAAMTLASCGGNYAYAQANTITVQAPISPGIILPAPGVYYSPGTDLEALDAQVIEVAQPGTNIAFAAYTLTDEKVVDALADRAAHGVTVRIYLDRGELQAECRADATCARIPLHKLIGAPGVEIRVKRSKVLMHLKAYEVEVNRPEDFDAFYVRDGSANFSEAGERRQDNSLALATDPKTGAAFGLKFRAMWARPDNLTVAEALR